MQAKVVWVPYGQNMEKTEGGFNIHPKDNEQTNAATEAIQKLVSEGWNIVATVPVTGSSSFGQDKHSANVNYTIGYEVWLQKDKAKKKN